MEKTIKKIARDTKIQISLVAEFHWRYDHYLLVWQQGSVGSGGLSTRYMVGRFVEVNGKFEHRGVTAANYGGSVEKMVQNWMEA